MAIDFNKKTWVDRDSEYLNGRTITDKDTGEVKHVLVGLDEGDVYTEGTPFDADTFNDLEDRIEQAFDEVPEQIDAYTKAETDTLLADKADKSEVPTKVSDLTNDSDYQTGTEVESAISSAVSALETEISGKADKATTYTKTEVDTALSAKANTSDVETALASKADTATTYTKTEVDTALANKADKSDTYTKSEVDSAVGAKSTVSVAQSVSTGTKIGTVTVDGVGTDFYAPDSGSDVSVTPIVVSGVDIATITVDGVDTTIKAPAQVSEIDDSQPTLHTTYSGTKIENELADKADATELVDIRKGIDDLSVSSPNLYNLKGATDGYFLNTANDNPTVNVDWYYTDYIPVQSGVTYGISRPFYVNAYSSVKAFMKNAITITNVDSTWAKFTVPSDVSYIRISAQIVKKSSAMLVVGETKPSDYHPCGLILDALQFLDNSIPLSKLQGYKDNFYVVVDANGAGDYTTISDAVSNVPSGTTIIVMAGDYKESVKCQDKTVYIIGIDKYKCRVWNDYGDYDNPPFYFASGCLKNLTIENVYDSTKDYSGITNTGEYAIHIDTYPVNKKMQIDNCIIKSVWNNVLGCGARNNEVLEISNCTIIADKCQLSTDVCEGFNMHGGAEGDSATVIFRNNVFRNVHGANDIKFSIKPNTQSQNIKVEAYFNVAENVVNASPNFVHIQKGSYGNQSSVLNYSES